MEERGEKRKNSRPPEESSSSKKNKEDEIESMISKLLTPKEKLSEQFMDKLLSSLQGENQYQYSADLSYQQKIIQAEKKLNGISSILAHKLQPIFKELMHQQNQVHMNDKFGVITSEPIEQQDWSEKYKICFTHLLNDENSVSLVAPNANLLKQITKKDYFTLLYFSYLSSKRQSADNLLQIFISGRTSCGKTIILENPLNEIVHSMTTEKGVGRYDCLGKSVIGYHDIQLKRLLCQTEIEKIKSLTRGEPISGKIHSKTKMIQPMHIVISSNQKINLHRFKTPKQDGFMARTIYKSDLASSKTVFEADLEALRYRFLEIYLRDRPKIPEEAIPTCGMFSRNDAIKGLMPLVIEILQKYKKEDFASEFLFLYCLVGACKNLNLMGNEEEKFNTIVLLELIPKFKLSQNQVKQCFEALENEPQFMKTETQ